MDDLAPQVVVCNEATDKVHKQVPTWVALLYQNDINATVCSEGRRSTVEGIDMEELLRIVDEAEQEPASILPLLPTVVPFCLPETRGGG